MTSANNLLFSWADVEQRPELQRLQRVLDAMPDGDILDALEERRGHGRDDVPVAAMWRAMLAGIVFQHESAQSLLRELQRNPALLALCGFPALPRQSAPKRVVSEADGSTVIYLPQPLRDACNFSRFLRAVVALEEERGMIAAMIRAMREQLMEEADDFGEFLGYDGKAMESHSTDAPATGSRARPRIRTRIGASARRTGSTPRPASPERRSRPGSATVSIRLPTRSTKSRWRPA